jgi:hypothetical protein
VPEDWGDVGGCDVTIYSVKTYNHSFKVLIVGLSLGNSRGANIQGLVD